MLQKLLIVFCTLILLSACGGSSNNSAPESQDPPQNQPDDGDDDDDDDDDDDTGDDDDDAGDDDDTGNDDDDAGDDDDTGNDDDDTGNDDDAGDDESGPWVNIIFDAASDVDTWSYACVSSECNATATLEHNAEAEALDITPEWVAAGDQIEVSTTIDPEIADLTDGYAHLNLYVPEAYTEAGDMIAQVFFQDASDRKAYIGYRTAATGWNTFYFEDIQLGTADNDPFGYFNDGFDLTNINRVGVQLQSAEGQVGLEDTLHIDDVIISAEAIEVADKSGDDDESSTLSATMDSGWRVDGDAVPLEYVDDGVEYSPTAADQQFVYDFSGPIDLSGASFVISYTIDQDFLESGANVQPFAQTMNETGSPAHWSCWENNGSHTAGEVYEATCDGLTDFVVEDGVSVKVGLQPKGDTVAGTLTIHSLEVTLAE